MVAAEALKEEAEATTEEEAAAFPPPLAEVVAEPEIVN